MGENKKSRGVAIAIVAALAAVGVLAAVLVGANRARRQRDFEARQAALVFDVPAGHSVGVPAGTPAADVPALWLASLLAPYQSPDAPAEMTVGTHTLLDAEVLEQADGRLVARVEFSFPYEALPPGFDGEDWMLVPIGGVASGYWVVPFAVQAGGDEDVYTATGILMPAQYDLQQYNQSGQREADESYYANIAEIPYTPAACPYKIEGGICSVSYDGGENWVATPLPVDELAHFANGRMVENALQEGSFVISPEKTVFLYGGYDTPLKCLYSDDAGQSWHEGELGRPGEDFTPVGRKFVAFAPGGQTGCATVGHDGAMSWEACFLYATRDGGRTWQFVLNGPGDHPVNGLVFFDDETGFISYNNGHMDGPDMARTADGGLTWHRVYVDIPEDLKPWFNRSAVPEKRDDGSLVLHIGEDEMSDFSQLQNNYLQYVFRDGGHSWAFEGIVEKEVFVPG